MKKDHPKSDPGIKVVEEENQSDQPVVVLGEQGEEKPVRLGGVPKREPSGSRPQRLDLETAPAFEARSEEPDVEKILESEDLMAPDEAMEKEWGGEAKRWMVIPWGWFVLIAVVCGGLALWSLRQVAEKQSEVDKEVQEKISEMEAEKELRFVEAKRLYERLEARVSAYLAADSIPELLKHVRDPKRVEPLMKKWYAKHPLKPAKFQNFRKFQPVTLERQPFWILNVETDAGSRSLLVEQTDDDDGLVDWETDVCYQPMDWNKFVAERPEGKFDFRVRVRPDVFYSHEFADESRYRCLRLTTRGSDEYLFGYVVRGSDEERRIYDAAQGNFRRPVSLILRIGFLPGSPAMRSVKIYGVIGRRWCLIGKDGEVGER